MYHNNNHRKVQVAVITGSSKGIGKAIATEFAKAGYSVVINARDEGELKQASEDISQSTEGKNKVVYVPGDISQEQISESLIQEAINTFGRIDVLVNNAGIGGRQKKIDELTSKDWDEVIDINLKGAFLCTREAVKNMLKGGTGNYSIINISSVHEYSTTARRCSICRFKGWYGNAN